MTSLADFRRACAVARPRSAVVLGSGLADVAHAFVATHAVANADIPGLAAPGVPGHRGELALGTWAGVPVLVCFGRVHFYEGHPWERVTRLVHLAADLGATRAVLTNAAGGLHPDLNPGDVMLIAGQVELLAPTDWPKLAEPHRLSTPALVAALQAREPRLMAGVYAGLTGPCYETPAEIRALAACGIDAVGMSTVREVRAAVARGLEVVGLSCITNKAAGLAPGTLHHADVQTTARLAVGTLARLIAAAL